MIRLVGRVKHPIQCLSRSTSHLTVTPSMASGLRRLITSGEFVARGRIAGGIALVTGLIGRVPLRHIARHGLGPGVANLDWAGRRLSRSECRWCGLPRSGDETVEAVCDRRYAGEPEDEAHELPFWFGFTILTPSLAFGSRITFCTKTHRVAIAIALAAALIGLALLDNVAVLFLWKAQAFAHVDWKR